MRAQNKRSTSGFTLVELIAVITIVIILLAVAIPNLMNLQRDLRQTELDDKAQTVYLAAQNQLVKLRVSGRDYQYTPSSTNGNGALWEGSSGIVPAGYVDESDPDGTGRPDDDDIIAYFASNTKSTNGSVSSYVLPESALDPGLYSGYWVVEYSAKNGTVYSVFYSESSDIADTYVSCVNSYRSSSNASEYKELFDTLRNRENRISTGATVGYYGKGTTSVSNPWELHPNLSVVNGERLYLQMSCVWPRGLDKTEYEMVMDVELSDGENSRTVRLTKDGSYYADNTPWQLPTTSLTDRHKLKVSANSCEATLLLDSLESSDTRFANIYGSKSTNHLASGEKRLNNGTKLTITLRAYVREIATKTVNYQVLEGSETAYTNSLFAYESGTADPTVAALSCVRHLQNLDSSANPPTTITKAKQLNDLTCADNAHNTDDWATVYATRYFNGVSSSLPLFRPIQNANLTSYDGQNNAVIGLNVNETASALKLSSVGLFAESAPAGTSFSNLRLQDAHVIGSATSFVGALVGQAKGTIALTNVYSYVNADTITAIKADTNGKTGDELSATLKTHSLLVGGEVGGLVGNTAAGSSLTVEKSLAATLQNGAIASGGLLGRAASTVYLKTSYADSYLFGASTGGLVAGSTPTGAQINVHNCYAAGFQYPTSLGAGLVNADANVVNNSYTVCYTEDAGDTIPWYATAKSVASSSKLFYLHAPSDGSYITGGSFAGLTNQRRVNELGSEFKAKPDTTRAYNLQGIVLPSYEFPGLKLTPNHYGDWTSSFQEGGLVYYEVYDDGTVGVYGASLTSTLNDSKTLIGDGYAVVYTANGSTIPDQISMKLDGVESVLTLTDLTKKDVTVSGETYRLFFLPASLTNIDAPANNAYYHRLVLGERPYAYNPHFAASTDSLAEEDSPFPSLPEQGEVMLRSARHFYNLSRWYAAYDAALSASGITLRQGRDIDYAPYGWQAYANTTAAVTEQPAVGNADKPFRVTYDGGGHTLAHVGVNEEGNFVGLFGYNSGTLCNLAYVAEYTPDATNNFTVRRTAGFSEESVSFVGSFVGYNSGTISNCAVAGVNPAGVGDVVEVLRRSYMYLGGFVGANAGYITHCSAQAPVIQLSSSYSTTYAGDFVGWNIGNGEVVSSYALGRIVVQESREGLVHIAGFAGSNDGAVSASYCATVLEASGTGCKSFGFAPTNGFAGSCQYLNGGAYSYHGNVYTFTSDTAATSGTQVTKAQLSGVPAAQRVPDAAHSLYHPNIDEDVYPFRAVVTDAQGSLVHYGDWLADVELGEFGMFYWEQEEGGSNAGYNLTFLGVDPLVDEVLMGSTLCCAHDDGGVVTRYGYGYYQRDDDRRALTVTASGIAYSAGEEDAAAAAALHAQLPEFKFHPFQTRTDTEASGGSYIYLSAGADSKDPNTNVANGSFTISRTNDQNVTTTATFAVSPFFGNSLSVRSVSRGGPAWQLGALRHTGYDGFTTNFALEPGAEVSKPGVLPGAEDNQYEIRSLQQLQYLNWNYRAKNASTLVTNNYDNYSSYTYLAYASATGDNSQGYTGYTNNMTKRKDPHNRAVRAWKQTHDLAPAADSFSFTPIAGMATSTAFGKYENVLYAWFGGQFDGQNYRIQNFDIISDSYTVGVFGVTVSARVRNVVLYSDQDNQICRDTNIEGGQVGNKLGAYLVGGLVASAYDYNFQLSSTANNPPAIENCAIAGYRVVDKSANQQGGGDVAVGGLVGQAFIPVERCSAVTTIVMDSTYANGHGYYGSFVCAGGLVGAAQKLIANCYTGGEIQVTDRLRNEVPTGAGEMPTTRRTLATEIPYIRTNVSANVFASGVGGCSFASSYQNFKAASKGTDEETVYRNCYTYVKLPLIGGNVRAVSAIGNVAHRYENNTVKAITFENCYFLEKLVVDFDDPELLLPDAMQYATNKQGQPIKYITDASGNRVLDADGNPTYEVVNDSTQATKLEGDERLVNTPRGLGWYALYYDPNPEEVSGTRGMSLADYKRLVAGDARVLNWTFRHNQDNAQAWYANGRSVNKNDLNPNDPNQFGYLGTAPTSVTTTELMTHSGGASENMVARLNGTTSTDWDWVTIEEGPIGKEQVSVKGKYSFSGNNKAEEGKDYPYPTIITQRNLTYSTADTTLYAHVHYGSWPLSGSYWEEGIGTIDLIADRDVTVDPDAARKAFTLHLVGTYTDENTGEQKSYAQYQFPTNQAELNALFVADSTVTRVAAVELVSRDDSKYESVWRVIFQALGMGTSEVVHTVHSASGAAFDLEITAEIRVEISASAGGSSFGQFASDDSEVTQLWCLAKDRNGRIISGSNSTANWALEISNAHKLDIQGSSGKTYKVLSGSPRVNSDNTGVIYDVRHESVPGVFRLTFGFTYHDPATQKEFHGTGYADATTYGLVGLAQGGGLTYVDLWRQSSSTHTAATSTFYTPGDSDSPLLNDDTVDAFLYETVTDDHLVEFAKKVSDVKVTRVKPGEDDINYQVRTVLPGQTVQPADGDQVEVRFSDASSSDEEFELLGIAVRNLTDGDALTDCRLSFTTEDIYGAKYQMEVPLGELAGYVASFKGGGATSGSFAPVRLGSAVRAFELPDNVNSGDNTAYERPGYAFVGWVANEDVKLGDATVEAGTRLNAGETVLLTTDTTFTAQWTPVEYTIHYDLNGATLKAGAIAPVDETLSYGSSTTAPTLQIDHGRLIEWNTERDGSGVGYAAGDTLRNLAVTSGDTVVLYAQYEKIFDVTLVDIDGDATSYYAENGAIVGYTAPDNPPFFTSGENIDNWINGCSWTFEGWVGEKTQTATVVVKADGDVVPNVSGYTDSDGSFTTDNPSLYGRWRMEIKPPVENVSAYTKIFWNASLPMDFSAGDVVEMMEFNFADYDTKDTNRQNDWITGYSCFGFGIGGWDSSSTELANSGGAAITVRYRHTRDDGKFDDQRYAVRVLEGGLTTDQAVKLPNWDDVADNKRNTTNSRRIYLRFDKDSLTSVMIGTHATETQYMLNVADNILNQFNAALNAVRDNAATEGLTIGGVLKTYYRKNGTTRFYTYALTRFSPEVNP